jgi:hypothetical protein
MNIYELKEKVKEEGVVLGKKLSFSLKIEEKMLLQMKKTTILL